MSFFSRTKKEPIAASTAGPDLPSPSDINALLYKRNAELATKNKALSLLGSLYETSILALQPEDLARKISDSVCVALNYEFVSIFLYHEEEDKLIQVGSAFSDRYFEEIKTSGHDFNTMVIEKASTRNFFEAIIKNNTPVLNEKFGYVLNNVFPEQDLQGFSDHAHIKSSLVYPLSLGGRVLGMFLINMNREYDILPDYEKDIIKSIVNVISLAIDKSLTYEALHIANEKLKSLDKLKTEFLSLAAHQLRSPLTAIRGYTSMLIDGDFGAVGDKQKEAINRVFESSTHLSKVVEDLLNVSKIEAGGMKYEMAPFDMEKAAKDLTTDLSITAEKKGLKLTFATDNKSPYTINGDMEKLRQVMLNIIDNAIKYTEKGSISVMLSKDAAANTIKLAVTDTGMGISAEEKEKLFQKFSRGAGGKTNTSGSGLGLYLAKTIAEAHGGHISIDSPGVGMGSTFSIELKIA